MMELQNNTESLNIGDWIKHDIIGLGFYEIVSIDDVHLKVKLLRLFDGKNPEWKGHITCVTHGSDKEGNRIKIDQKHWYSRKIRRNEKGF